VEGLVDLAQRDGGDRDARVLEVLSGQYSVAHPRAALRLGGGEGVRRQLRRKLRCGKRVLAVGERHVPEHLPARVATLAVGTGRKVDSSSARAGSSVRTRRPRRPVERTASPASTSAVSTHRPGRKEAAVVERPIEHARRGTRLLIDAVEEERALLRVGDTPQQQQAERREHEQTRDQTGPQRGHHDRGARSAYPTPRTVW